MILTLVTESTAEPVSVADQKLYMRIESTDSTAEDGLIGSLITAARKQAEIITKRALVSQTWQLIFRDFDSSTQAIELPRAPLSTASTNLSITFIEDTTVGNSTTVPSTAYTIDAASEPGRVFPSFDNEWPDNVRDQRNAVTIQYVSGYSTTTIPAPIVNWIKMRALDMYENRESLSDVQTFKSSREYVNGMLDPYIIKTMI